ncbi:MAG TPA: DsbA family oxidoreductase [bacterium]|nr:DsbA family oxidoreductase [bacterium]
MALKIEIYSDVICPWCYLGESRLKKALESLPKTTPVEINYLPYELNPATAEAGVDRKKYLEAKYGPRIKEADQRLRLLGQAVGIEYNFDKAERIPNTLKAHRLIWFASQKGLQEKAVTGLFKAYFTDGIDIGDDHELAAVASEWGMDHAEVIQFLKSAKGMEEVRALEERAYNLEITGVPFFIFNGKAAVSGAQEVETFTDVLRQMTGGKAR